MTEDSPVGSESAPSSPGTFGDDPEGLLAALRNGDEGVFVELVERHSPAMLRTAQAYVGTRAAAEDVVQDTWIAAISALDRFEGRSAVRTWLFSILLNIARSRRVRDRRTVPFSSLLPEESGPSVDPTRFLPAGDPDWPHHWLTPPRRWTIPEDALLSSEIRVRIRAALDDLPPRQAAVVSLHDVQGYPVAEVCILLELSPGNVRILLHRGRTRIRESLERYLVDGST